MGKTIAYSHRGGYWKTRYTFLSSCYAFINRTFLSFGMSTYLNPPDDEPSQYSGLCHRHDDDETPRTSFYGFPPDGSGIAVTFNNTPSQNKVYKAFSLESTNNVNGLTAFTVNNSTVAGQIKNVEAGPLREAGGIMYGHIGQEVRALGANINYHGRVQDIEDEYQLVDPDPGFDGNAILATFVMRWDDAGYNNLVFEEGVNSKLFLNIFKGQNALYHFIEGDFSNPDQGIEVQVDTLDKVLNNELQTYQAFPGYARPISVNGDRFTVKINFRQPNVFTGMEAYEPYVIVKADSYGDIQSISDMTIYSITPESLNGDDPKGQTADAVVTLGSAPYELYALNVEYSPTNLDHSN